MAIGSRDKHGEWYALTFHHYVSFTAQLSSVCRVTSCFLAPPGAGYARAIEACSAPVDVTRLV
ncbi:hypothetical protein STA22820_20840 [Edwardsiella ictaluri]|nr:hypothetical protein STA22820_20840 [Edwardsiella ictaluri]BEI19035.1 hypothetical protein STH22820_09350 [Edwardsiella ictaluri]BEI20176.1 hypothetical protein STH22820_20760 [Edwardsiella ictaluri]